MQCAVGKKEDIEIRESREERMKTRKNLRPWDLIQGF